MPTDKQGRVMWTFYVAPAAKAAVEELAKERGETTSATLRHLLSLGLQYARKDRPAPAQTEPTVEDTLAQIKQAGQTVSAVKRAAAAAGLLDPEQARQARLNRMTGKDKP